MHCKCVASFARSVHANGSAAPWPSVHLIGTAIDAKGNRGACATGISRGRESELELPRAQRDLFHHALRRMIHLRDVGDNDVC